MSSDKHVSAGQRRQMIAEAAYFRAERRGFAGGDPVEDWYAAEAEVDARLRELEADHVVGRLEEQLAAATRNFELLKKKMKGLSKEARAEWESDAEKLAKLRKSLEPKIEKLREQGERAGQRVRQQAEKLRTEIAEIVQRVTERTQH